MDVNSVSTSGTSQSYATQSATTNTTSTTQDKTQATQKAAEEPAGVYEKSSVSNNQLKALAAQALKDSEKQAESLKKMILKLLQNQKKNSFFADLNNPNGISEEDDPNKLITITPEIREAAKEAVSENGYYGVKQTSERILDFAKALSGNNPETFDKMKAAILDGFKQAESIWGDKLPDISQQTYDAVIKGLDEYEAQIKGTATVAS